jgi:signal transduction histidine kinase
MADFVQPSIEDSAPHFLARWDRMLHGLRSPVARYGLAVISVLVALGLSLLLQYLQFRDSAVPLLIFAIAISTWYVGNGPAVMAIVLSSLCFDYFFTEPYYSLTIADRDLPYFFIFLISGIVISGFCAARRRIEENLRRAQKELERRAVDLQVANKELESFAYSVSHDLRAPLRHVVGYAELLQKHTASSLDEKSQRYMKTILDSAKRMGVLIDDLLGFSRIGRASTNKTMVDLGQLASDVIAEQRTQIGDRDIAWNVGVLPACYGDRAMLRVALMNLISNAVKFSRDRDRAEITIGSTEGHHDQIEVFVRDNGAGFDMRYADKLFGVFQRLHASEEFEGTGIGLATVQRIIHRHGGNIRAEGGVDRGATFYFSLPRV